MSLTVLLPSLFALLMTFWVYFKILQIAKEKNIVDKPAARKLQTNPVPVLGGVSVFFGVICGILLANVLMDCVSLLPILLAMCLMIYVGAIDDIIDLTPVNRLLIEVLAVLGLIFGDGACVNSLHGLWGIGEFSWWIGVPLTVLMGVGIINAMNMIDGVNGLSSGMCITCSLIFGFTMYKGEDYTNTMLALVMAGSLFPFLIHNVLGRTSKMYVGDAGTMSMGILMCWFVMQMLRVDHNVKWASYVADQHLSLVALTLAIMSVPVIDTLRVMMGRIWHHKSPFKADQSHLHHQLLLYSNSHSLTSIVEILMALFIDFVWLVTYLFRCSMEVQFYTVVTTGVVVVVGIYFFLHYNLKRNTRLAFNLKRFLVGKRQGDKNWWQKLSSWIDTPHEIK